MDEKNKPKTSVEIEQPKIECLKERAQWSSQIDFLLACIGNAVGLGNIWRFPYLCYKNGGGAFLIPYLIMLFCGGLPVMLLEIGLGQYMSRGGLQSWNICHLFQGIGIATFLMCFLSITYYIVILAWGLYYMYASVAMEIPWGSCFNTWNTYRCASSNEELQKRLCTSEGKYSSSISNGQTLENMSLINVTLHNSLINTTDTNCSMSNVTAVDPAVEFWENHVIQISDSIEDGGGIVPQLAVCLLVMWILVYFCVWRGVKWSGKVCHKNLLITISASNR